TSARSPRCADLPASALEHLHELGDEPGRELRGPELRELLIRLLSLCLERGAKLVGDGDDLLDFVLVEPDAAALSAAVDLHVIPAVGDVLDEHELLALGAVARPVLHDPARLGPVPE